MFLYFKILSISFLFLSSWGCKQNTQKKENTTQTYILKQKLGSKENVSIEYSYLPILNGDTQNFWIKFGKTKTNKYFLGIDKQSSISYSQKMLFIQQTLDSINRDFPLGTISQIETFNFGRSTANEELASNLSLEYFKIFGPNKAPYQIHPDSLSTFLSHSSLATDLNKILHPYHLKVESIRAEKAFIIPLNKLSNTREKEIYEKSGIHSILDTWLWISIKKNLDTEGSGQ